MVDRPKAVPPDAQAYLTPAAVARLFNVHYATILKMIRRGDLYGFKMGRSFRIPRAALDAMIKNEKYVPELNVAEDSPEFAALNDARSDNARAPHGSPGVTSRQGQYGQGASTPGQPYSTEDQGAGAVYLDPDADDWGGGQPTQRARPTPHDEEWE